MINEGNVLAKPTSTVQVDKKCPVGILYDDKMYYRTLNCGFIAFKNDDFRRTSHTWGDADGYRCVEDIV